MSTPSPVVLQFVLRLTVFVFFQKASKDTEVLYVGLDFFMWLVLFSDVVSSDVNAKAGATKDYDEVLHTVVFGAGDDPEENTVCFDIIVNDDDVVEHLETFHLELQNIDNALYGEPRIAEVFIEDNDGEWGYTVNVP